MTEVVIVGGIRTAIGNYGGALQGIPVVKLGSVVIKGTLKRVGLWPKRDPEVLSYAPGVFRDAGMIELEKAYYDWGDSLREVRIEEVIMGNVLQAGQGQNTARQSAIYTGIPEKVNA